MRMTVAVMFHLKQAQVTIQVKQIFILCWNMSLYLRSSSKAAAKGYTIVVVPLVHTCNSSNFITIIGYIHNGGGGDSFSV